MSYNAIVIGSGPAGYGAALRLASRGKSVAVVEKAETGGTCLNWGCIPTKALLRSAQVYAECCRASAFGIVLGSQPKPDMTAIVARSRSVADMVGKGVQMLLKKAGVEVIQGKGRIAGDHAVDVDGRILEAENIIIATGARPRTLPGMEVDHTHVLDSKDALQLSQLPESMIVVGSGAIGSEFAYLYSTFGVSVTVVEYLPQIMPLEDEEIARAMERVYRKLKVSVRTSTAVKAIDVVDGRCEVTLEGKNGEERLSAEKVLVSAGITANIEDIGLEEAGVRVERGRIVVDSMYRTNIPSIYAVGDVIPTPALAHVATAEARVCADHICGLEPEPVDYSLIPSCIFTEPEVASVGITEKQAQEKGMEYTVGRYQFAASGKATAMGERDGFVKLIFDRDDTLVGAHMVGPSVAEILAETTLASRLGAKSSDIAQTIHSHPTLSETVMEASATTNWE